MYHLHHQHHLSARQAPPIQQGKGKCCPNSHLHLKNTWWWLMMDRHGGQWGWGGGLKRLHWGVAWSNTTSGERLHREYLLPEPRLETCFLNRAPLLEGQEAAALLNRRTDLRFRDSAPVGPARGRGCLKCRAGNVCVFCLRMGCYHIQTPGGHWLDRNIPLATLSVGQEACTRASVCLCVWVR